MGTNGIGGFDSLRRMPVNNPVRSTPNQASGADFAKALEQADRAGKGEKILKPVPGEVIKSFSNDHPGIDLQADIGTPVIAASQGTVESSGWAGSYGNLLVVRHNQHERAYYAHLSEMQVHPGQTIKAGDTIAASGNTGQASLPHLHFELRESGQAVDPQSRIS